MSAQQENDTKESTIARINKTIDHTFAYNICNNYQEWEICNFQTHDDNSCSFSTTKLVHGLQTFYQNFHLTTFSLDSIIHLHMKPEEKYMTIANWVGSIIQLDACAAEDKGRNEYEIHGNLFACYDCNGDKGDVYLPCDDCFGRGCSVNGVCILDLYIDEYGNGEYEAYSMDEEEAKAARECIQSDWRKKTKIA